jgi:hypothetical protein
MTGLEDAWQIHTPSEENSISFRGYNNDEMLKLSRDGFYVRGVKVPADAQEAQAVYEAFKAWLTWANLQRR